MNTLFFFVLIFLGGPLDSLSLNPAEKPSKNFGILYALFSDLALVLRQSFVSTFPDATGLTNGAVWPLQPGISDSSSSREGCVVPRESEQMTQQMDLVTLEKGRLVEDNFVTSAEAKRLKSLGMAAFSGRSKNTATPFSYQVPYLGMTYPSAVSAVKVGNVSIDDAELFLSVSEKIRRHLVSSFKLKNQLYHHFSHIVCRSPNVEAPLVSEGKYLPAHSDSCWLNVTTGTCDYSGAFTWRHFTSLLYLHEDFTGGDFFFSVGKHNISAEAWVSPKSNRMLAFSAGEENIHGVTQTSRGVRCILEQWFTTDSAYQDLSYAEARRQLLW